MSTPASATSANESRTRSATVSDATLTEILVDAGPLIAGFDASDVRHEQCSHLLQTLPGPLLVPATIVAEACYMISRYHFGAAAEAAFLRSFTTGDLVAVDLAVDDFERMAQLVEQYSDFPLGGSDASVIAIAERRSITTIFTTDRRHFAAVRPKHVEAFTLLP